MPLAIGAVVEGQESAFHTPLSGHFSPVLARVPTGYLVVVVILETLSSCVAAIDFAHMKM